MSKRLYGEDRTIHRTTEVNVERDPKTGAVLAVWFRCERLPFTDRVVDEHRAKDLSSWGADKLPGIVAVKLVD